MSKSKQSMGPRREKRTQAPQTHHDASLLRQQIDSISAQAPRYLFRLWSSSFGGDARLNSTERVIPHAFLDNNVDARRTIHHLGREQIVYLATMHMRGDLVPTVFSSWTQSLPDVFTWRLTNSHQSLDFPDDYIAVVDTTMLDPRNVYEYLIYGVVEGPGYKAIPCKEFAHSLKVNGTNFRQRNEDHHPELVVTASQVAKLYGSTFEAAIMSHLLAARPASPAVTSMLASKIAQLHLPDDWLRDADPMRSGANVIEVAKGEEKGGEGVAVRASAASESRTAADIDKICAQKAGEQNVGGEEADAASDGHAHARRMKRMMEELYIDMIGWRPHELPQPTQK
ncbi:hypothetical protein EJ03DRAFT_351977 [Teratosphaeria nubilosa]|uniref:DUF7587 domain-containing protein n=1 Tax=Teratosphaeria nubilosa TaxID=161662 RepID=A0A6G1L7K2_9PEZI|nr:hypothetical protein EJ03DRAFT_351977 [Teratosphaeria nubilosa]